MFVWAFLALLAVSRADDWTCVTLQSTTLAGGATWTTENCTNVAGATPLLTVNSISFSLSSTTLRAVPAISIDPSDPLKTVPEMATQDENFIAGINGGYFWRVDIDGFWIDDV
eukprot:gene43697-53439_t